MPALLKPLTASYTTSGLKGAIHKATEDFQSFFQPTWSVYRMHPPVCSPSHRPTDCSALVDFTICGFISNGFPCKSYSTLFLQYILHYSTLDSSLILNAHTQFPKKREYIWLSEQNQLCSNVLNKL